jgi:glutamyl-tRNA synthetase
MEELAALNARIVHQLDYEAVAGRLPAGMTPEAWAAIRPNLATLSEAADWWQIIEGPIDHRAEEADREFLATAADIVAQSEWTDAPWKALTAALKERTGRAGKALFHPLRQALTGRDSGPEMALLLHLIGKDQAIARLRAAAG